MLSFGPEDEAEVNILSKLRDPRTAISEKRGMLVEEILYRYHIATIEETDEMLWCSQGVYIPGAEQKIQAELQTLAQFDLDNHTRSEVMRTIRSMTYKPREEFDKDANILNLKNCLLNVETGEFSEHSWEYLSRVQLPVYYDKTATCPNILRFLRSALGPDEFKVVIRMVGYLLICSSKYEKAFMNTGIGANGKSTWLKTLKAFLGADNISNVSLQEIVSGRFAAASLDGKLANIFPDLKAERLADTGIFKALVSGDRVHVQKKHQNGYSMENYAKLIFSANSLPETSDDSHAFYRRWCIISWNHVFEGEEKDENLLAKLTTEEELSGLLNVALVGLKRLRAEHGFEDTDREEIRKQYQNGASKINDFIEERCTLDSDLQTPTFAIHEDYDRYCKASGANFYDITDFGKKLKVLGIERKRKRKSGDREYVYSGIGLKSVPSGPSDQATFQSMGISLGEGKGALVMGTAGTSKEGNPA